VTDIVTLHGVLYSDELICRPSCVLVLDPADERAA